MKNPITPQTLLELVNKNFLNSWFSALDVYRKMVKIGPDHMVDWFVHKDIAKIFFQLYIEGKLEIQYVNTDNKTVELFKVKEGLAL